MSTHHRFQAIADPQGANIWIFAGTRRTVYKRLAALPLPRPFRVELYHHTHEGNLYEGTYNTSLTRRCRDLQIH